MTTLRTLRIGKHTVVGNIWQDEEWFLALRDTPLIKMAKQRIINTHFWDDTYIIELDPIEKLLFLYLLTNPCTDICGAYEINIRRIALDTGIDKDMILKIFQRFESANKITYREGWVLIHNFIKNQATNPSVVEGIKRSVKLCPEWVQDRLSQAPDSLSQPVTPNLTKPNLTQPNEKMRESVVNGKPSLSTSSSSEQSEVILDGLRDRMGCLILPREVEWLQHIDWATANKFTADQFLGCYDSLKNQEWRNSPVRGEHVATALPDFAKSERPKVPQWQININNCDKCDERGYILIEGKHGVCKHD